MRLFLFAAALTLWGCRPAEVPAAGPPVQPAALQATPEGAVPADWDAWGAVWYQGEAELTSYDLEQARYGEVHDGTAVLIFVTEDVSLSEQVKLDRPGGEDAVSVLKLNATRQFNTGIYPYSTLTSVFTPIDGASHPSTLKVTTSVQEWCGHVFAQLNRDGATWRYLLRSYFQSDGDVDASLEGAYLEDAIWTAIRINPEGLPKGSLDLIPGTLFLRFAHREAGPVAAEASLSAPDAEGLRTYTVAYPSLERRLAIRFRADFPHAIESWTESSGTGDAAQTTTARRRQRAFTAYWAQNGTADEPLRQELLGLDP